MDTKKTFCIKCGSEILHNTKFCEQCGAPVYNETAVTSDTNVNNNRNNNKALIIVISSLVAVLIVVVIVFLVLLFSKGKANNDDVITLESELTDNSENTTEYMTDDVTQSKEHDNDETTETESVKETEITEEQTTEKVTEEITTESSTEEAVEEITIKFHYYRYDGEYEGWNVWFWANNEEGQAYYFDYEFDDYGDIVTAVGPSGAVTKITLPAGTTEVGFIVRYNEWEAKDYIYDQYIDTSVLYAGTMEVFTESGMNGYSYRICDDYIPPKTE